MYVSYLRKHSKYEWMYVCLLATTYVCTYACMYYSNMIQQMCVCMYVCMCVCMYTARACSVLLFLETADHEFEAFTSEKLELVFSSHQNRAQTQKQILHTFLIIEWRSSTIFKEQLTIVNIIIQNEWKYV